MINSLLPKIKNHFANRKYFYLLAFICLVQIFLAGQADLSKYDPDHDIISYRKMALAFPSIDYSVGKPFAHRLLAPWLVGLIFNDVDLGFTTFNALFSVLFILTLFYFLKQNKISERIAFFITTAFVFNRYFIPNFGYEPQRFANVLSNLTLILSFIFLIREKYRLVLFLSLLGVLARESALLIIPVGLIYILTKGHKNKLPNFISLSLILIVVFICIRLCIPVESGISLAQAFSENWTKLFSPEAIAKQFFLAFNPFFLIPLISFKEFIDFNKINPHWLALLGFTILFSLFGGDKERLMFTYAPIYYIFISGLFQKLEEKSRIKWSILISILFFCWMTNLHHIWGIVKLPSREISLGFAVAGGLIMLLVYLKLRSDRNALVV